MLVPAKDVSERVTVFPAVTVTIVVLNVLMFLVELALGDSFIDRYALKPVEVVHGHQVETLLTSMFMHSSLIHIAGNMVFLVVFGTVLESDYLGRARFVAFYLMCGLAAEIAQIAIDPTSNVALLGASGAIAGVMGGYIVVFPKSKIMTMLVIPIGLFPTRVTAGVFIGIWFVTQLFSGVGSLGDLNQGGVAYFAHVGGFISGVLLILLFRGQSERE